MNIDTGHLLRPPRRTPPPCPRSRHCWARPRSARITISISYLHLLSTSWLTGQFQLGCRLAAFWETQVRPVEPGFTSHVAGGQKTSVRLILGPKYNNYEEALKYLHMETLDKRRDKLCINFAEKCIKLINMKALLPMLNKKHIMDTRLNMKFHINKAKSQKYKFSAVPQMQRMLNQSYDKKVKNYLQCIKSKKWVPGYEFQFYHPS